MIERRKLINARRRFATGKVTALTHAIVGTYQGLCEKAAGFDLPVSELYQLDYAKVNSFNLQSAGVVAAATLLYVIVPELF